MRCKNERDGPYCVSECPISKYPDDAGICQDCHDNCEHFGCTGPLNSVGYGACNACALAVYDRNDNVTTCLPSESECEEGYFTRVLWRHGHGKKASVQSISQSIKVLYSGLSNLNHCKVH